MKTDPDTAVCSRRTTRSLRTAPWAPLTGRSSLTRFLPFVLCLVAALFACSAEDPIEVINHPPSTPSDPVPPSDTLQRQPMNIQLSWKCSDPEGGKVEYDIHFGTSDPPPLTATADTVGYAPPGLEYSRTYFWQIVAKDDHNQKATGDVWAFKTVNNGAPDPPTYVSPTNEAVDRPVNSQLQWSASTDPEGDPVTYDVYFGPATPPALAASDRSATFYLPAQLQYEQTYYWRIVAKDNRSNETSGPVWSFTTVPNLAPSQASSPEPQPATGDHDPVSMELSWTATDPEGDPLTYNVYFGTASNPPLVSSGHQANTYPLQQLDYGRTYYWKIDVHDDHQNTTPGTVWSFKTVAGVWTQHSTPTSNSLWGVWGTSHNNVIAVGSSGTVLHYDGTSWQAMSKPTSANNVWFYGIHGTSASNITAVGHNGSIGYVMYYNGSSWTQAIAEPVPGFNGVWYASPSGRYMIGNSGMIVDVDFMTSGTTENLYGIWGTAANNIFVTGNNGTLLHYNGSAWSPMTSGTSNRIYDVWGTSASNVYAVGWRTHLKYDGSSWSPDFAVTYEDFRGVWGTSASDVFAVGTSGAIIHFDGAGWNTMSSGTSEHLYGGVWGTSSGDVFAVGDSGTILHFGPPPP